MISEMIRGFGILILYLLIGAGSALLITGWLRFPREARRKSVHILFILTVFVYMYAFETWQAALGTALLFAAILYPVIPLLERVPRIMDFVNQRAKGELRSSLVGVQLMFAALIVVFWGALGGEWKYIIVVAVLAWGFGDAAAAIVGKAIGKHTFHSRWIEGAKTLEGSLAMAGVSFIAILASLLAYAGIPWYGCLLVAALVAPVCAVVELFSHKGTDTVTVPIAAAFLTYGLITLFFH